MVIACGDDENTRKLKIEKDIVYYGFNKDNSLVALNIGYTEMLANFLVGNEGICDYEEELLATNLISQIIGEETLFNAYFNNDAETVYKKMLEAEVR